MRSAFLRYEPKTLVRFCSRYVLSRFNPRPVATRSRTFLKNSDLPEHSAPEHSSAARTAPRFHQAVSPPFAPSLPISAGLYVARRKTEFACKGKSRRRSGGSGAEPRGEESLSLFQSDHSEVIRGIVSRRVLWSIRPSPFHVSQIARRIFCRGTAGRGGERRDLGVEFLPRHATGYLGQDCELFTRARRASRFLR